MSVTRRQFVIASSAALGAAAALPAWASIPWTSGEERPKLQTPIGSIDCHMHLYDDRIPAVSEAKLRPANASLDDYLKLQERIGVHRMVIVTPSTYGFDNRVMLEGLKRSNGAARGIAVVEAEISSNELEALHNEGVRGVRFNLSFGGTRLEDLERLASRVHEHGWHVQLVSPGNKLIELRQRLAKLPSKLVIDHMGQIDQPGGALSEEFSTLRGLLDTDNFWVKASAPYNTSKAGAPHYEDFGDIAKQIISHRPDRVVWGSDWPHPTVQGTKPNDAQMLDLLLTWAPIEKVRNQILRDNALALYDFQNK